MVTMTKSVNQSMSLLTLDEVNLMYISCDPCDSIMTHLGIQGTILTDFEMVKTMKVSLMNKTHLILVY